LLGHIIRDIAELLFLQEVQDHRVIENFAVAVNDHLYDPLNRIL
jgi:hypothetical protein